MMQYEQQSPDEMRSIPHATLIELIEKAIQFLTQKGDVHIVLLQECERIATAIQTIIPGIREISGLGFPFYYLGIDGANHSQEIQEHMTRVLQLIRQDNVRNPDGWPCTYMQASFAYPDLRTYCNDCPIVALKPRDIFKAIPDIDLLVIGESDTEEALHSLECAVNQLGYFPSDTNLARSIYGALSYLSGGDGKMPIDMHYMSASSFTESLLSMRQGEHDLSVAVQSLHKRWESYQLPFGFDFMFSFTELLRKDTDITDNIRSTRKKLFTVRGADGLFTSVSAQSAKAERLLQDEKLKELLLRKFLSWENDPTPLTQD